MIVQQRRLILSDNKFLPSYLTSLFSSTPNDLLAPVDLQKRYLAELNSCLMTHVYINSFTPFANSLSAYFLDFRLQVWSTHKRKHSFVHLIVCARTSCLWEGVFHLSVFCFTYFPSEVQVSLWLVTLFLTSSMSYFFPLAAKSSITAKRSGHLAYAWWKC